MTINPSFVVFFLSGLFLINGKAANDPSPSPIRVSNVTFLQGTALTNDDGTPMAIPHWIDEKSNAEPNESPPFPDGNPDLDPPKPKPNNVKSYAYSYVSNRKPMVQAVFKWKNGAPPEGSPYSAEGKVVNTPNCEFNLPKKQLEGDTTYPATVADQNIVMERCIQAYVAGNRKVARSDGTTDLSSNLVPMSIEWTVYDKNNKVVGSSQSAHTIYVTWEEPSTALRQETFFNLACETANDNPVDPTDHGKAVFEKIWSEFTDREVKRMDGTVMKYWGALIVNNLDDADKLIEQGDGSCGRWASLLEQCSLVNTVVTMRKQIVPKATTAAGIAPKSLMIVKQYDSLVVGPYPKQMQNPNTQLVLVKKAEGQGNPAPLADRFPGHMVITFGDDLEIFDPSYGNKFNNLLNWETNSLSFVLRQYDSVSPEGNQIRFFVIFEGINNNTITQYP